MNTRTLILAMTLCTAPLWTACSTTQHDAKVSADDQAAMMKRMMELGTPGPNHKRLEPMIGHFKTNTKMWMDPAAPVEESTGTCDNKWILGGRFVASEYKGTAMGMAFEGFGLMGYDNAKEAYVNTWCDNMSTMIMPVAMGKADSSGKMITSKVTVDDCMTGKPAKMRMITTVKSNNEHVFEMYTTPEDGKEFKTMEITYTRM